jgi:hypothetical protein
MSVGVMKDYKRRDLHDVSGYGVVVPIILRTTRGPEEFREKYATKESQNFHFQKCFCKSGCSIGTNEPISETDVLRRHGGVG